MKHNMETNIAEDACWKLVKIFVHQMSTYYNELEKFLKKPCVPTMRSFERF